MPGAAPDRCPQPCLLRRPYLSAARAERPKGRADKAAEPQPGLVPAAGEEERSQRRQEGEEAAARSRLRRRAGGGAAILWHGEEAKSTATLVRVYAACVARCPPTADGVGRGRRRGSRGVTQSAWRRAVMAPGGARCSGRPLRVVPQGPGCPPARPGSGWGGFRGTAGTRSC